MADAPKTRTRRTSSAATDTREAEQTDAQKRAADKAAEAEAKKAEREAEAAARKAKQEAEKSEREAKREQEKAERDAKREQEKAEKAAAREAEKAAKQAEKDAEVQAAIEAGTLITATVDGKDTTFTVVEPKKETVAQRALEVIEELKADGRDIPIPGKYFADKHGGGTVQWVAFFGMLRVLGMVQVYRFSTGERGESGLAYRWIAE